MKKQTNLLAAADSIPGGVYILFSAICWSLAGVFTRQIPTNALMTNALRSVVGVLALLVFNRFRLRVNPTILLGGVCVSLTNTLFFLSLQYTTVANATVMQYLMPVYVLIFSCIRERKLPRWGQLAAVAVAFGGVVVVFSSDLSGGQLFGNVMSLISGVTFAGVFFVNKLPGASSIDSSVIGFSLNIVIGLFFLGELQLMTPRGWLFAVLLGVFQHALAYIMFAIGIKRCSSFSGSLNSMAELIFGPLWAGIFLSEWPSLTGGIGFLLILAGIVWNTFLEKKYAEEKAG